MNTEEQIKAAIVVFPDAISMASPELNSAIDIACEQLNEFVDYLQTLDPELEHHEAITAASITLNLLPRLFEANPVLADGIRQQCQSIRDNRP
ncbi:hypothetical protein NLP_2990 [Nostoc sp. 'Lobaria pulmonaria (5183) cyanobiont']|nr:hypothetical protein NLP_2990 [Nostoc sp. 'Lobaria pulmonaria (5183) cyanobiont']